VRAFLCAIALVFWFSPASAQKANVIEANQKSVALIEEGRFAEGAPLARSAESDYSSFFHGLYYSPEDHVLLIETAFGATYQADGYKAAAEYLDKALQRMEFRGKEKEVVMAPLAAKVGQMLANLKDIDGAHKRLRQASDLADEFWGEGDERSIRYHLEWAFYTYSRNGRGWAMEKISAARKIAEGYGSESYLVLLADLLRSTLNMEGTIYPAEIAAHYELMQRYEAHPDFEEEFFQKGYAQLAVGYHRVENKEGLDIAMQKLAQDYNGDKLNVKPFISVKPAYAQDDVLSSKDGFVILEFNVDELGRVSDAKVVGSQGESAFEEAALKVIGDWRYRPQKVDGKARPIQGVQARIRF